jgi:uncharacterized membrane protein
MSEALPFLLIAFFLFGAPLVLSIVALVQTGRLRRDLADLQCRLQAPARPTESVAEPAMPTPDIAPAPAPVPATPATRPMPPPLPPPPAAAPAVAPAPPAPPPKPAARKGDLESQLGGRISGFIGIAAVVLGVAFFVAYAIQHAWIGPSLRVTLGLLAGAVLVGLGHHVGRKSARHALFARVMTGGGAALFYFSVYAAGGMYGLIGPLATLAALAATAGAVLALSALYNSQFVALMALFGAFVAPAIVRTDSPSGLFLLTFAAGVNVPIILLGLKRRWQWLYNAAFALTWITYVAAVAGGLSGLGDDRWTARLGFALLFFGQFAALNLLKLVRETEPSGRALDQVRTVLNTLLLLGATYGTLNEAKLDDWIGAVFVAEAAVLAVLAAVARRSLPRFTWDAVSFLLGALTFASLALPAQLDGAWVSAGWAVEGVLVAWFAGRVRVPLLRVAAVILGATGLLKSLFFDPTLYAVDPRLFLNGRFAVSLLSAAAFGLQGRLLGPSRDEPGPEPRLSADAGWIVMTCGLVAAVFVDVLWLRGVGHPAGAALTTTTLAVAGLLIARIVRDGPAARPLAVLGTLLLLAACAKLALVDLPATWNASRHLRRFLNPVFWAQIGAMAAVVAASARGLGNRTGGRAVATETAALLAALLAVTMEFVRLPRGWDSALVTIWWALAAFALVASGLALRRAHLRWLALAVFAVTIVKVFIIDLAELRGLHRVAAFLVTGVVLLALSWLYQRIAPAFLAPAAAEKAP